MNTFSYSYKTTLPKEANAPSVTINGDDIHLEYEVSFYVIRKSGSKLIKKQVCRAGETVYANSHQWFDSWHIVIYLNGELISSDAFNPIGKVVFIKMDAYALGDNISWIQYVEEFRKKHNCTVICSTFFNNLFNTIYPEILFVDVNTNIDNVYAQYYIGATNEENSKESPIKVDFNRLQFVASETLDIENKELRPKLENQLKHKIYGKKYVCISEYASHEMKMWNFDMGWQMVVDFLNSIDYDVVVISKEPTELKGVINLTGNHSILMRAQTLLDADFFIGVSSGLSWLSWALNTHVIMISDKTPVWHEFTSNVTRISANTEMTSIDYDAPGVTKPKQVIDAIKKYIN